MSETRLSPTDEVRRMLDERGIEHVDADDGHTQHTWWSGGDHEISACNNGKRLAVYNLTPEQAIAATVGNRTDLSKRLREVHGLHEFAELFGFDWADDSDWTWHDVACAMADAVDAATTCAVPETKYLMALDEAREAKRKLEMCQTIQRAYKSKCRSLKETNADLRRIIDDMKAATVGAGTCAAKRVRVPRESHVALGHYECGECGTIVGSQDRYCRHCGTELA